MDKGKMGHNRDKNGPEQRITEFFFLIPCCGNEGQYAGIIFCGPTSSLCNRDKHVFWDPYHPSEAANILIAKQLLQGDPKYVTPMNLRDLRDLNLQIRSKIKWCFCFLYCGYLDVLVIAVIVYSLVDFIVLTQQNFLA